MVGGRSLLISSAFVLAAFAGCIGDDPVDTTGVDDAAIGVTPEDWRRPLPEPVAGLEFLTSATDVGGGSGIFLHGNHAYVSSSAGLHVVNVSDPTAPWLEGHLDESSRDVDVFVHPDGRTYAALASGDVDIVDVTDPANPVLVGSHPTEGAVHNIGVAPNTTVLYNSRSLDAPGVDILDLADPAKPELVQVFGDLTCHDVTFVESRARAYCAGVRETQIWDISDPRAPTLVTRIHNPAIQIHHAATPAHEGDLLIIGDEFAGSTPAAAGCFAANDALPVPGTQSDPIGALWFYDTSDETLPVPIGYLAVPLPADNVPPTPCTAHFGNVVYDGDEARDLLIYGWRAAGTHLIDFADPSAPVLMDTYQNGGDTWEARSYNGYVFTGHSDFGLEVLTFA